MARRRWGGGLALASLTAIQTRPLPTGAEEEFITVITVTENRAKTARLVQFLARRRELEGSTAERMRPFRICAFYSRLGSGGALVTIFLRSYDMLPCESDCTFSRAQAIGGGPLVSRASLYWCTAAQLRPCRKPRRDSGGLERGVMIGSLFPAWF